MDDDNYRTFTPSCEPPLPQQGDTSYRHRTRNSPQINRADASYSYPFESNALQEQSHNKSPGNRDRILLTPPSAYNKRKSRSISRYRDTSQQRHSRDRSSTPSDSYVQERTRRRLQSISPDMKDNNIRTLRYNRSRTRTDHEDRTSVVLDNEARLLERLVEAITKSNKGPLQEAPFHSAQNIIPEFDPQKAVQTMKDWLSKIDELAFVYGWTERQTVAYALPKLKGLAKRWYDGLTSVKYSWQEWRNKLTTAFPCERNYAELLTEMLARKTRRNETLEEYYYDKTLLINRCELNNKQAVDCLTQGIYDNNVRMNVQGANLQNPDSVLKHFRSIMNKSHEVHKIVSPPAPSPRDNRRKLDTPRRRSATTSRVTCYNCGQIGHIVASCPKDIVKCTKCRKFGHEEKSCAGTSKTEKIKGSTQMTDTTVTKNVFNIMTTETSRKYFKPVVVNGEHMTSFVDLGSQCTILGDDIGARLKLKIDTTDLPMLKGFGSECLKPLGRVQVHINLDGIDESVEAYIVDRKILPADILIGQSLTELPQVRACKTKDQIIFYREITADLQKLAISCAEETVICGTKTIAVVANLGVTGSIYLDTEPCMREGREYVILPGLYSLQEGKGKILLVGLNTTAFTLPEGHLLARGALVSDHQLPCRNSLPSNQRSVHSITTVETRNSINADDIRTDDDLEPEVKTRLCEILNEYRKCFAFNLGELGKTSCTEMHIVLKDHTPVVYRPYRLSIPEREKVNTIINSLLANDIIRESTSEYSSPIIMVTKKNGEARLCVDYRALNQKTIKEKFPMPLIDDQLDSLSGQVYFTSLDLASGYHQVPVAEESKHVTAFVTPDGHYEYNCMPFGLTNAPAVFQRLILNLLKQRRIVGVLAYMDDIIIASKTIIEGVDKLRAVLELLAEANLTLNLEKCKFLKKNIEYLGFGISSEGIRPGVHKINAVAGFKTPQNVHEVRQFIGLCSFFRRFVQGFAIVAKPLTVLTKASTRWVWGKEQEESFNRLKEVLTTRPVLAIYNPSYHTELHTDASAMGLGGILLQRASIDLPLRPVAYFSRQTTPEEQRFHSYELETLAVVASLKRFRVYLLGIEFKVVTDCSALRTTLTKRDLIPRIARWWLLVQEFTFSIEYKPGTQMAHVDALSRNSVTDADDGISSIWQVSEVDWSHAVQMSDPRICHIKAILDSKCQEAKDIQENYSLKDGKVFRKINGELRWAVPRDAYWKITQQCHDDVGHVSYDKTLEKARRDYWFPKMARFIKKYVRACIPCAYAKQAGGKKPGFLHPIPKPSSPFQCLHIDHLGPFIKSKRGNLYVLGIIDGFTKFIILRAVKNTKSRTTITVLRDVFALFGTPAQLISDRGTSFTSNEFKSYIQTIGFKHTLNSVATPRANGQIERYNRTVLASLTASCHDQDDRDWDSKLGQVQWSLNNTINQGTGKSPTEIIFGRPTVNTTEGHLHDINRFDNIDESSIQKIRQSASRTIERNQDKMRASYDKKRIKPKTYRIGDLVMIQKNTKTPGESHKLVPPFSGPFKITAVLEHDRYEISSVEGYSKKKYTNIFPVDKIKPWVRLVESESETEYGDSE